MSNDKMELRVIRKKLIIRLIIFLVYLGILLYFYYLLIKIGINPFIITLLLVFILLISIGPFLRRNKRSLYSRMFPDRKRRSTSDFQKKKVIIPNKQHMKQNESKVFKPINLDHNYRKPIINKCEKCGNIVPSFVKTCPFCKNQILH